MFEAGDDGLVKWPRLVQHYAVELWSGKTAGLTFDNVVVVQGMKNGLQGSLLLPSWC